MAQAGAGEAMLDILIIDGTGAAYDGNSVETAGLGGIQSTAADLAGALVRQGFDVGVATGCIQRVQVDGVHWLPRAEIARTQTRVVVAINAPELFDEALAAPDAVPVLWLHNEVRVEKLLRRGQLWPLLRRRPVAVFVGTHQAKACNRLLPFRSRHVIGHGVAPCFVTDDDVTPRLPRAVFMSQAYRGFDAMARLWREQIRPAVPTAEFHAFIGGESQADEVAHGIIRRARLARGALAVELRQARLMLVPGHRDETFCLAAAESLCSGTPVVTRGIGALSERVRSGVDGVIAGSEADMATAAIRMLQDDALWLSLHRNAKAVRSTLGWDSIAAQWAGLLSSIAALPR